MDEEEEKEAKKKLNLLLWLENKNDLLTKQTRAFQSTKISKLIIPPMYNTHVRTHNQINLTSSIFYIFNNNKKRYNTICVKFVYNNVTMIVFIV